MYIVGLIVIFRQSFVEVRGKGWEMLVNFKIKKRHIALAIILAVLYYIAYWLAWANYRNGYQKSEAAASAVKWAMGMPVYKGDSPPELVRDFDQLHFTKKEWNAVSCDQYGSPSDEFDQACIYDENGYAAGTFHGSPCPAARRSLRECAAIYSGAPYGRLFTFLPFDDDIDYAAKYCGI
ncbi:MAG: hypothetical protein ACHP9Y_06540, partial [Gammaproteobacteria bacterium]